MYLANCIKLDEDALICDLAETYNIYNYKELPLGLVATLCFGLRADSRIKLLQAKAPINTNTMLLASAVDRLSLLTWMNSADGHKGQNRPPSILESLLELEKPKDYIAYNSVDEFEKARQKIIEG